jgi:hypothetical protein
MTTIGYRYHPYFFNVLPSGQISALCNVKYANEQELVADWDSQHGGYLEVPALIRVGSDGSEVMIRPRTECEFCGAPATRYEEFDRRVYVCAECSADPSPA